MLLVTGAAGHIGNVFIRNLLEHGYTGIRAMRLPGEDATPLAELNVEQVEADVTRPETLVPAFVGVRQVVHLASLVSIGDADAALIERVNVQGTANLLNAARAAGVQRFVYVSSIHALSAPETGVLDETRPLMPQTAAPYERTKSAATQLALDAARDLNVVIAVPGGVIGPLDFKRSEMGGLFRTWTRSPYFMSIPGGFDFADVRDVADGLRLTLERGRRGELYLLGGEYLRISSLARQVMRDIYGRAYLLEVPLPLALLTARFALKISVWLKKRPVFTPYSVNTLQGKYRVDFSKARRELGYTTRPLTETVRDTVRWWLQFPDLGGQRRAD